MTQNRHCYSIFIFFDPTTPDFTKGNLGFSNKPILITFATNMKCAAGLLVGCHLPFRPYGEVFAAGLTESAAKEGTGRLISMLGFESEGGPLKDLSKASVKKKRLSQAHRGKIASAMTGRSPSKETREKLRAAALGKPKPWLRGNEHRSLHWKVTDPYSREYHVFNLSNFCREHGVPQGGLWAVAAGRRRHYKWWKCRKHQTTTMMSKLMEEQK